MSRGSSRARHPPRPAPSAPPGTSALGAAPGTVNEPTLDTALGIMSPQAPPGRDSVSDCPDRTGGQGRCPPGHASYWTLRLPPRLGEGGRWRGRSAALVFIQIRLTPTTHIQHTPSPPRGPEQPLAATQTAVLRGHRRQGHVGLRRPRPHDAPSGSGEAGSGRRAQAPRGAPRSPATLLCQQKTPPEAS